MKLLFFLLIFFTSDSSSEPLNDELSLSIDLFFQSFLPVDSLIFLSHTNKWSFSTVEKLVKNLVFKFGDLLKKSDLKKLLDQSLNFNLTVELKNTELEKLLVNRNSYLNKDRSQIAKKITQAKINTLLSLLNSREDEEIHFDNFEKHQKKFLRLLRNLHNSVSNSENYQKKFYKEFSEFKNAFVDCSYEKSRFNEIKGIFNLGGFFLLPSIAKMLMKNLLIPGKEDLLEKTVQALIKPIEEIELLVRLKSNEEKKEIILDLINCATKKRKLKFKNWVDKAFEFRSVLLNNIFTSQEKIDDILLIQKGILIKYRNYLKKVDSEYFKDFVIYKPDIKKKYIKYLLSGEEVDKKELLKYFA